MGVFQGTSGRPRTQIEPAGEPRADFAVPDATFDSPGETVAQLCSHDFGWLSDRHLGSQSKLRFDQQTVIRSAWRQFVYIVGGFQQRLHFGGKAQRPVVSMAIIQMARRQGRESRTRVSLSPITCALANRSLPPQSQTM